MKFINVLWPKVTRRCPSCGAAFKARAQQWRRYRKCGFCGCREI